MFNFNTSKRSAEPNLNTAAAAGAGGAIAPQNDMGGVPAASYGAEQGGMTADLANDSQITSKIEGIEAQRREIMKRNPDFDMKAEMQNPQFVEHIWRMGLPVEDAYFLVHRDEIISDAVNSALERISMRRSRIAENGAGKNSPAVVKKNPKEMSDKEIDDIIERVQNGEKISF